MLDQQDAEVEMRPDAPQQLRQIVHLAVVQPAGRLIEHQQLRPADQRTRQFHALLRAERQAAGPRVGDVVQVEKFQQIVQPRHRLLFFLPHDGQAKRVGDEAGMAEMVRADQYVVANAHRRNSATFWKVRPMPRPAMRCRDNPLTRASLEPDVAVGKAIEAADAVEQRGLAGAVRPDQAADLAVGDIE